MSTTESDRVPPATEVWFTMNSLVRDQARHSRAAISSVIDIPFSRFRALRRIAVQDLTQRDLAERMGVDAPAMSGIVTELVELGLVRRRPHPDDARSKLVSITDAGRRAVAAVIENPQVRPAMFAALDPAELTELARLLDKLRKAAEA